MSMAYSRDFPNGCGTISFGSKSFHGYTRNFPTGCGPKPTQNCPNKPSLNVTAKHSGSLIDSSNWRRPLKTKPPKNENKIVMKGKKQGIGPELELELGVRAKVVEMLRLFRERCDKISREEKEVKRVELKANAQLKKEGKIIKQAALTIGPVPGVEIGDKFYYRVELVIVGLHRLLQSGIDYMEWSNKDKLATCIVANEGYFDKMNDPNVLTYVGEGGIHGHQVGVGVPPDQQLKGGNLALFNSIKEKNYVRVVRGLRCGPHRHKIMYVYDGLYVVTNCEKKKGVLGNVIFEFRLIRCPGQASISWTECRRI